MRGTRIAILALAIGLGISHLIPAPAFGQAKFDDRGGVLYLALAPELKYDPYGKYCGMSGNPLPSQAITEGEVGPAPQVAFVLASWPDSARPEYGAVAFGLRYPRGLEIQRWGTCGNTMNAATSSFPLSGEGIALAMAGGSTDTSRTIEIAWLVVVARVPCRLELVPHPDARFAAHFATTSEAITSPIADLGALGFGQPGTVPRPQWPGPSLGAACVGDSICVSITKKEAEYYKDAVWLGEDVVCTPDLCRKNAATGACCLPTGSCAVMDRKSCVKAGGAYRGDATSCTPDPCKGAGARGSQGPR